MRDMFFEFTIEKGKIYLITEKSFCSFFALHISFYFIIMKCCDVNITVLNNRDHSFINLYVFYMWDIITKYNCLSNGQSEDD